MTDEMAPEAPDVEESRRLKEAVASLGASMREDMARAQQDPVGVPIMAEPRERTDPRVAALVEQVATLISVQDAASRLAEAEATKQATAARTLAAELAAAKALARNALVVAAIAIVVGIGALALAVAQAVGS